MYVEHLDLDLGPDDEHARLHGEGGTVRTVLGSEEDTARILR